MLPLGFIPFTVEHLESLSINLRTWRHVLRPRYDQWPTLFLYYNPGIMTAYLNCYLRVFTPNVVTVIPYGRRLFIDIYIR